MMHIAYGLEVRAQDDPYLLMLEKAVVAINKAEQLGGKILDVFPFCMFQCLDSDVYSSCYSANYALVVPWCWFQELCYNGAA